VGNLESILDAVDGAMVARGDLGAELAVEEVLISSHSVPATLGSLLMPFKSIEIPPLARTHFDQIRIRSSVDSAKSIYNHSVAIQLQSQDNVIM
jgi:hypothetical protein